MSSQRRNLLPLLLLSACLTGSAAITARAGCGCDHPPPAFAPVMPPFASPGKAIRVHADGFSLEVGSTYDVTIGGVEVSGTVETAGMVEVEMPEDVEPGAVEIRVEGSDVDHTYGPEHFTALASAPVVPAGEGVWSSHDFELSVTADGTLLIPFNLTEVLDGTQFAFQMGDLPLRYAHDDIVFYNEDGIDLTLFTLDVDSSTERQWGSYHGWTVEQDRGFFRRVWQRKIRDSILNWLLSDMLTYWRHEFHTYKAAHLPGGSHEVSETGYHAQDGTLHIDHDHLVLAISNGLVRDPAHPLDPSKRRPLEPGGETAHLFVATSVSDDPVEPNVMEAMLHDDILGNLALPMLRENASCYRD